jgi:hypothetical protein
MDEHSAEAVRGLRRMDGYLYWQAEISRARRAACAFTGGLPWLTAGEREDVERRYIEQQLHASRETVDHLAERCRELQQTYEQRYRRLRQRLVASLAAGTAIAAALAALAVHLLAHGAPATGCPGDGRPADCGRPADGQTTSALPSR